MEHKIKTTVVSFRDFEELINKLDKYLKRKNMRRQDYLQSVVRTDMIKKDIITIEDFASFRK